MAYTKTTIGAGTKVVGQVTSEADLTVEGQVEGGPLRVHGRLTVAPGGAVSCDDTEVGDALVIGVFTGTLRARDIVRVHQSGRVLGEILAPRVGFVSDQMLASLTAGPPPPTPVAPAAAAAPKAAPPAAPVSVARAAAPTPAPVPVPAPASAPAPVPAAAPSARTPKHSDPGLAMPHAEPPQVVPVAPTASSAPVPPPAAPAAPVAAPAAAPAAPAARVIPTLPSLGQRTMQRRD